MWSVEDCVLAHCRRIYGARVLYRNRAVYIKTEDDTYQIDLSLADQNIYRFRSVNKPLVLTETCLVRGFFRVSAHATYKKAGKIPTNKDWKEFLKDAYVIYGMEEKE